MAYFLYYIYTCLYYKVCIRKKWPIFIVYLKRARIFKKKYQRVQQMLNWFSRGHTDLELCKCRLKFSWTSVHSRELENKDFQKTCNIFKTICTLDDIFSKQTPHSRRKNQLLPSRETETQARKIQFSKNSTHYITILKK